MVLCIALIILNEGSHSQWSELGNGLIGGVRALEYDTTRNILFAVGHFALSGTFPEDEHNAAYWDGSLWNEMGEGLVQGPAVSCMLLEDGSLLVSGFFLSALGISDTRHTALWREGAWESIGSNGSHGIAWGMLEDGGSLYVVGGFDSIAGVPSNRIARFLDGSWGNSCAHPTSGIVSFTSIVRFNNELIVGGNLLGPSNIRELGWLDGDTLRQLGQGILGDSWVNDLVVFHDELFIGGEFHSAAGNAGSGLMSWDGMDFSDPVPGVQFITQVSDLDVRNGELYISGRCRLPGSSDYYTLARYDGERICLFGKNLNTVFSSIAASEDRLYVAPNMITLGLGGDTVNYIASYDLNFPSDTCITLSTGIAERSSRSDHWSIHPNPCSDRIMIRNAMRSHQLRSIEMRDALGRLAYSARFGPIGMQQEIMIELPELGQGSYSILAFDERGHHVGAKQVVVTH